MKRIMEERNIDRLYHFTQASNLKSILEHGIMPKDDLDYLGITSRCNDEYRFDGCTNAVCTSLEFPNYRMFYSLRMKQRDIDWAVIMLDARIVYELPCAFCWTNASDSMVSAIPIQQRMGRNAFENLFADHPDYPKREQLHIPDFYPTNPQAEVLVFDTIPVEYIKYIYFENVSTHSKYIDVISQITDSSWNPTLFAPRKDWEFWQTR